MTTRSPARRIRERILGRVAEALAAPVLALVMIGAWQLAVPALGLSEFVLPTPAQIIARMWAQGVSRNATETFYRKIDACALDHVMRTAETEGWNGSLVESRMVPLMADSSRVIKSPLSTDPTERLLPGATYDASCTARIAEDRLGFALLVPLLLERGSGNVYARDLQGRDSLLLQQYPGRPVYLLRHEGSAVDAPFDWIPLRRDSLMGAWRGGTP